MEQIKANVGELLNILHSIQDNLGYIPLESLNDICGKLNISFAQVIGFISFYKDFRLKPLNAKHHIRVCQAESCQSKQVKALVDYIKEKTGLNIGEGNTDFFLDSVYCLGNCACSPSIMVDGKVYGGVDREKFNAIVNELGINL